MTSWFPDDEAYALYPAGPLLLKRWLLRQQAVATDPHPYRDLTTANSPDHQGWS